MTVTELEKRARQLAIVAAQENLELLKVYQARGAHRNLLQALNESILRDLDRAEGRITSGVFQRAVVKRSSPHTPPGLHTRADDFLPGKLGGYAARFNSQSVDLGGYLETIAPGAFTRSLASGRDVKLLFDHSAGRVMASTKAGTLKLWEDGQGLAFSADVGTERAWIKDELITIDRREVTSMSFGFATVADSWLHDPSRPVRTLIDVELLEISVVAFPAYPAASVGLDAAAAGGRARRQRGAPAATPHSRLALMKKQLDLASC